MGHAPDRRAPNTGGFSEYRTCLWLEAPGLISRGELVSRTENTRGQRVGKGWEGSVDEGRSFKGCLGSP